MYVHAIQGKHIPGCGTDFKIQTCLTDLDPIFILYHDPIGQIWVYSGMPTHMPDQCWPRLPLIMAKLFAEIFLPIY